MAKRRNRNRIRRNDPCPCGSGRKHKRCCLRKAEQPDHSAPRYHVPYHQPVFDLYLQELGDSVEEKRTAATRTALDEFFSQYTLPAQFPPEESVAVLKDLLGSLEKAIADVVGQHHLYYWLHLYRRITPADIFGHPWLTTVALHREIMETAFLKYGRGDIGDDLLFGDDVDACQIMGGDYARACKKIVGVERSMQASGQVFVGKFGLEQFLELLSLERLAAEYLRVTACLRRAYKGGLLVVDRSVEYRVENDHHTESLITSYDDRNQTIPTTVATTGVPLDTQFPPSKAGRCFLPRYNYECKKLSDWPCHLLWQIKQSDNWAELEPNFLWGPFNIDVFYSRHEFLSEPFEQHFGISLATFVRCILALCTQVRLDHLQDEARVYQLLQRAYVPWTSLDLLIDRLLAFADYNVPEGLRNNNLTREECEAFFKLFAWEDDQREVYGLHTRGPRKLIMPTWPEGFIVDFAALPPILFSVAHGLNADWSAKGRLFEDHVKQGLASVGFQLWECQHELVANDGTDLTPKK